MIGPAGTVRAHPGQAAVSPQPEAPRTDRFRPFHAAMLAAGVYLPPSAFEAWFVSTTHGDAEIDQVARAAAAWAETAPR